MKQKSIIFFILLGLNILGGVFRIEILSLLTKPLLMPVLLWIVWADGKKESRIWLSLALIFSLFGDIFLLFDRQDFFVFGLGSFLLAHLTYIYIYQKKFSFKWLYLLPFISFAALFCLGVLKGHLSADLEIPVYSYISVIMLMGFMASNRTASAKSHQWVLLGAILFILSDAFIAVNQFITDIPFSSFWVMSTYGIGQFMIVKGLLNNK
jgi:uncharacterized membrane protein YhhN